MYFLHTWKLAEHSPRQWAPPADSRLARQHRTVAGTSTSGLSSATCLPTSNPVSLLAPAFTGPRAPVTCRLGFPRWVGLGREEWEVRGHWMEWQGALLQSEQAEGRFILGEGSSGQ